MKLFEIRCGATFWVCARDRAEAAEVFFDRLAEVGLGHFRELDEASEQLSLFGIDGEQLALSESASRSPEAEVLAHGVLAELAKPGARSYHLSERMHDLLIAIMNDACADDPRDVDCWKLRNVIRAAKIHRNYRAVTNKTLHVQTPR